MDVYLLLLFKLRQAVPDDGGKLQKSRRMVRT